MSMIPKGTGDTIWGGLDWSPEKGHTCCGKKQKNNKARGEAGENSTSKTRPVNYGRIISFGKEVAEAPASEIKNIDFRGAVKGQSVPNNTCRDVYTEYHDMGIGGIKAIAEYKVYTADAVIDLLKRNFEKYTS